MTYLLDLQILHKKTYVTNPSANIRSNFERQLLAPANPGLRVSYSEFQRLEMKDLVVLAEDDNSMFTPAQQSESTNLESYMSLSNSISDLNIHL